MLRKIAMTLLLLVAITGLVAQNLAIARVAQSLKFSGSWKTATGVTHQLHSGDFLKAYNGASDYPAGSKYHVGECKTFVRIIVCGECGYALPSGYTYANYPLSSAAAGDILQKKAPHPHTMIVVSVKGDMIKVLHSNWSARHQLSYATFSKKKLARRGFKIFKVTVSSKRHMQEPVRVAAKYPVQSRFGSWRVEISGTIPYYRVCQGTVISHSGPGGQVRVNETRTVSNTLSVSCGVDAGVVSAKVGFDVTSSFSRSLQFWKDVAPGKYGYVDLYYKYMVKKIRVYYKPWVGSEYLAGTGEARKFQAVEFQYRESSN